MRDILMGMIPESFRGRLTSPCPGRYEGAEEAAKHKTRRHYRLTASKIIAANANARPTAN
jgi:hypothetical protein